MDNLVPVLKNIVSYALPIITCVTVLIGGVWTLYKYFKEKNREFYLEILAKVYEPLFTQLVKMEYSRKLLEKSFEVKSKGGENSSRVTLIQDGVSKGAFSVKEVPFISWGSTKTYMKTIQLNSSYSSAMVSYLVEISNSILEERSM